MWYMDISFCSDITSRTYFLFIRFDFWIYLVILMWFPKLVSLLSDEIFIRVFHFDVISRIYFLLSDVISGCVILLWCDFQNLFPFYPMWFLNMSFCSHVISITCFLFYLVRFWMCPCYSDVVYRTYLMWLLYVSLSFWCDFYNFFLFLSDVISRYIFSF